MLGFYPGLPHTLYVEACVTVPCSNQSGFFPNAITEKSAIKFKSSFPLAPI